MRLRALLLLAVVSACIFSASALRLRADPNDELSRSTLVRSLLTSKKSMLPTVAKCSKYGFVLEGDCITPATYTPAGARKPLSFLKRCGKGSGWSKPLVHKIAARMGCAKEATACATAAGAAVCKAACTSLAGVAQALGMGPGLTDSLFHGSFRKQRMLPCDAECTRLDKMQGRCPE